MLFGIIILFVFGGWAIGKIIASMIPDSDYPTYNEPPINITNHTTIHKTEQHLHISEDTARRLSKKS